jgi:hypothetical protein
MKKLAVATALLLAFAAPTAVQAEKLNVRLMGYQEVPAVSTQASGEFEAQISPDEQSIEYTLSYRDMQGTVTQAHIHFGQRSVNGGIVVWLCGTSALGIPGVNDTPGPAGTDVCTPGSGHFSGTITSTDVVAITGANAAQQISAGELAEVVAAIRAGVAYVNVHTHLSPGGEIRGQLGRGGRRHHGHH